MTIESFVRKLKIIGVTELIILDNELVIIGCDEDGYFKLNFSEEDRDLYNI